MENPNIDPAEIAKFNELARYWWDNQGALRTLHDINPLRLNYINERVKLKSKNVIDIGCGGGILSEGMDKLGAHVTGIDMSQEALTVAKLHQHESGTKVTYHQSTAEAFAEQHQHQFDVITCLEMLEHVPDPLSIVNACATLVKPGGDIIFSTINRSPKSYLFAIIGAEYILKMIPKNTHDYAKFIRPNELAEWIRKAGLTLVEMKGLHYNPLTKQYKMNDDVSVNYFMHVKKG